MEDEIKKMFEEHERRIRVLEKKPVAEEESIARIKGVKEFLADVNPKDDLQKTASFEIYLERHKGEQSFNAKDIEGMFLEAREAIPKNVNDKINQCVKKGWIMEHTDKKGGNKAFVMTTAGERAIKNKFKEEDE